MIDSFNSLDEGQGSSESWLSSMLEVARFGAPGMSIAHLAFDAQSTVCRPASA
jgi:hypothetical protein